MTIQATMTVLAVTMPLAAGVDAALRVDPHGHRVVTPQTMVHDTPAGPYRSSTNSGSTWSVVAALSGASVYDIEFAPDGTVYIDSVWSQGR